MVIRMKLVSVEIDVAGGTTLKMVPLSERDALPVMIRLVADHDWKKAQHYGQMIGRNIDLTLELVGQ
jgi:hypothetical protein